MSNCQINGSIVLYHNEKKQLLKAINSFLNTNLKVKLYLIDNSSNDNLKELAFIDQRIEYIFNNANLGYGKAHNIAIRKSMKNNIKYHVVLNPDIYFDDNVISNIYSYMNKNPDVGNIMPKILYPNGDTQYLAKLLPTPFDWIARRFLPSSLTKKMTNKFELRYTKYDSIMNVPFLSGCFMFLRVESLNKVGLFDEAIFMYMEDIDLNRRLHSMYKTLYYPEVYIYHEYERGSHKNFKLFIISIKSSIQYFNKWGWFFDSQRAKINNKLLKDSSYE